jgi:hypothetical protein
MSEGKAKMIFNLKIKASSSRALLPLAWVLLQGLAITVPDAGAQSPMPSAPPFVQQGKFLLADGPRRSRMLARGGFRPTRFKDLTHVDQTADVDAAQPRGVGS